MRTRSTSIVPLGLVSLLLFTACKSSETEPGDEGSGGSSASGAEGGAGGAATGGAGSAAGGGSASGGAGGSGPIEPLTLIDCDAAGNSSDNRCKSYPDAGTIGEGPAITDASSRIDGAVLDGSSLIVAVDLLDDFDDVGGVMRIDLPTGNRTWLSGEYQYTDDGEVTTVGEGPEIGSIHAIAKLSTGKLIVYRSDESDNDQGFFEVDMATGDRTDFMLPAAANHFFTCGAIVNVNFGENTNLTAGTDGDFYATGEGPTDSSIVHFTKDKTCEIISEADGTGTGDVGTGPAFGENVSALKLHDGQLYALTGFTGRELFVVDPATGNRTLLSSEKAAVGAGPKLGHHSLDVRAGKLWTAGYFGKVIPLVSVDPATGDRVDEAPDASGPVDAGLADVRPQIFFYGEQIIFETSSGGIGVFDPATQSSNWISM